jgi:Cft2 family RNA processing exonuclease
MENTKEISNHLAIRLTSDPGEGAQYPQRPYLDKNPLLPKAIDLKADYIVLTHAHGDHLEILQPCRQATRTYLCFRIGTLLA